MIGPLSREPAKRSRATVHLFVEVSEVDFSAFRCFQLVFRRVEGSEPVEVATADSREAAEKLMARMKDSTHVPRVGAQIRRLIRKM